MKKRIIFICSLACLVACMLGACSNSTKEPITTPGELLNQISRASDGDVLYVGDIDFTHQPGIANEFARIDLKKSVAIKSVYRDRSAVFNCASFNLQGSKVTGEVLSCSFEGICFDGGADTRELAAADWENRTDDAGNDRTEPFMAQYAVNFCGNVDAAFTDCCFTSYAYENGPAMWAYYGDYTGNGELLAMLGDYSNCRLNVDLENCVFDSNASLFGGGAIYIDACDNVSLRAENCVFSDNVSGCGTFSEGGGACRFSGVDAQFLNCVFSGNVGNCHYEGLDGNAYYIGEADHTQGGAVCSLYGKLDVSDCAFSENTASLGGAVYLLNTDAQMSDCAFSGNRAFPVYRGGNGDTGPWTGMGMGGAIYINSDPSSPVRIYDSSIDGNEALYAYAGIYAFYTEQYSDLMPLGLGSVDLYGCSVTDNHCGTAYDYGSGEIYPWASHPGCILDIEYMKFHGCVIADETFEEDFPRNEGPSAENDYSYIVPMSVAEAGSFDASNITIPQNVKSIWYSERREVKENAGRKADPPDVLLLCVSAAVLLAAVLLIIGGNRKNDADAAESTAKSNEPAEPVSAVDGCQVSSAVSRIIFSRDDIEAFRENVHLRQLLTDREMEVMCEYVSGSTRSALAEKLCISEATAKTHISNIYSKLGVRSKQELLAKLKTL